MRTLLKTGYILSLLVICSPLIFFVGGIGTLIALQIDDSAAFGFTISFFAIPGIMGSLLYYYLVHRQIARAHERISWRTRKRGYKRARSSRS